MASSTELKKPKKKKQSKRSRAGSDATEETPVETMTPQPTEEDLSDTKLDKVKSKKDKKKKKKKKTKRADEDESESEEINNSKETETTSTTDHESEQEEASKTDVPPSSTSLTDKQQARKRKRDERKRLMEQIPKVDPETGLSFTKQQMRRMCKRVAKGLNPLETPHEKHVRKMEEAQLKQQEEALYHDDAQAENESGNEDENGEQQEAPEADDDQDDDDDDEVGAEDDNVDEASAGDTEIPESQKQQSSTQLPPTKKRRTKAVPDDYTCMACQNKHTPRHWIYDCPSKVTMRGTNQVSAKHKGLADPDARKVFVSGLPFDATKAQVTQMFASAGRVNSCKLLTFADTKRCKGQAILAFDTLAAAQKALTLSGTTIDAATNDDSSSGKESSTKSRKELKLKVTKVLNRAVTKKSKLHKQQPQRR